MIGALVGLFNAILKCMHTSTGITFCVKFVASFRSAAYTRTHGKEVIKLKLLLLSHLQNKQDESQEQIIQPNLQIFQKTNCKG